MALSANKIKCVRQKDFIPVQSFTGLQSGIAPPSIMDLGEIGTTGTDGLLMNTDGDIIYHLMSLPSHWDRENDIRFAVVYSTQSATAADTILWKVTYKVLTLESTEIAAASTALDTVVASDNVAGTASVIQRSPQGILKASTIGNNVRYIGLGVEMDTKAVGLTEDIHMLGLEIEYTPKFYKGRIVEAPAWANVD